MKRLLFVIGSGGPAPEYAIPKLVERATVFALPLIDISEEYQKLLQHHGVELLSKISLRPYSSLVDKIVAEGTRLNIDAILTFSEFALCTVSQVASLMGLKGVGPNVIKARSKTAMRMLWQANEVPNPRFIPVSHIGDLDLVAKELKFPLLLKSVWGAGSVGQDRVEKQDDLKSVYEKLKEINQKAALKGYSEYSKLDEPVEMIAEELINSTTESWYDVKGYGDYLSVEGLVVDGKYHPVCITSRLPTIFPYTELANLAPCPLPASLQKIIETQARAAVNALKLENCGTHTEFKLLANNKLCLLETAARLPGAMVCREVEDVFGIDLLDCLLTALLGGSPDLPEQMLTSGVHGAAASVAAIATDSTGKPWAKNVVFRPEKIRWEHLISEGSVVELVKGQSIESGSDMPIYDSASGVLNFAGLFYLKAASKEVLINDTYAILDHLKHELVYMSHTEFSFQNTIVDINDLSELALAGELNGPWHEPNRIQSMLDNSQYKEFVYQDTKLIGFIRVLTDFSYNAFIADLVIHPDFQSQGLGAELIHRATAKFPKVKFILQSGEKSKGFYEGLGFENAAHCVVLNRRF